METFKTPIFYIKSRRQTHAPKTIPNRIEDAEIKQTKYK